MVPGKAGFRRHQDYKTSRLYPITVAKTKLSDGELGTVGRCADGALGDTLGEFKVEHRQIFVIFEETLQNL